MLKNYFITAWRSLSRNKVFSIINVFGLAIGIAIFLLIFEYVSFEWSANRFNTNYNQLYRVNTMHKEGEPDGFQQPGFAPLFQQQVSGIKAFVRLTNGIEAGTVTAQNNNKNAQPVSFREDKITYVDGNFFNVFSFKVKSGSLSLQEPKTLAISESAAKKYFGNTNIVGKTMLVNNQFGKTTYTVTAVYEDMPQESDLQSDILLSFSTLASAANRNENDWADPSTTESSFVTMFLLLDKGANANNVTAQLTKVYHNIKPQLATDAIALQPLSELHLAPSFSYPFQTFGSLSLVVSLLSVSLLIVLIAWINYINLSTAQALKRSKEVGVRKVLGASRSQLVWQYLTETLLLTLCSAAIAVVLVLLLQPMANQLTEKPLSLIMFSHGIFPVIGVLILIAGSFLSGYYIAFVLSSFKPVTALKESKQSFQSGFSLRKALVVFQFTISIIFIIATLVLYKQLQYMQTEKLGMNVNQLLVIKGTSNSSDEQAERNAAFKNVLATLPWVQKYTATNNIPGGGYNFSADGITSLNPKKDDNTKGYSMLIVDNNYFNTYDIDFAQGETFTQTESDKGWANSGKIIINQKAATQLGFAPNENVAGKKIKWGEKIYEVKGVVKDYHHLSLRQAIDPMIFLPSVCFDYFTIQTSEANMKGKLATLQTLSKQYFPDAPFDYFFEDEAYDKQYANEQKLGNVFIASAVIAVLIACLGLFGLAAFAAQQRVKEIGIRKVLGASVANITTLLSKDFLRLIFIAFIIASPIAWFVMNKWLQNFVYRITISWWMFIIAGAGAVFIALCTISFQAIKAAVANPVKSLRSE